MYIIPLTYFITLITTFTFSETVNTFKLSGTVISSNNDKPIPNGIIVISPTKGYKVNSLGKFTISGLTRGAHKLSFSAFGYEKKDTVIIIKDADLTDFKWSIDIDCGRYSAEAALKDIKSKNPKILLQGGIAPIIYSTDKMFSDKYNIRFYDFGCVAYDPHECLISYNQTIFEYLDKTFGKKWRTEIRKDVIGLRR